MASRQLRSPFGLPQDMHWGSSFILTISLYMYRVGTFIWVPD